jgi:hypothetical protein
MQQLVSFRRKKQAAWKEEATFRTQRERNKKFSFLKWVFFVLEPSLERLCSTAINDDQFECILMQKLVSFRRQKIRGLEGGGNISKPKRQQKNFSF